MNTRYTNFSKALLLGLSITLGVNHSANAQAYTVETSTQTYKNITNNTSLTNGAIWDDPEYTIPVGFEFEFFGRSTTEIIMDEFNLGAILSLPTGSIGSTAMLIAYSADLADRGLLTEDMPNEESLSDISYTVEGDEGSRIFKLEWENAGFWEDMDINDTSIDFVNLQLWLYEGSNVIEVHFGPKKITQPLVAFEGEVGPSIGLAKKVSMTTGDIEGVYVLNGDPGNPKLEFWEEDDTSGASLTSWVPENTVYRFTPATVSVPEVVQTTDVQIYPNPTSDVLFVDAGEANEVERLSIIDAMGKQIATMPVEGSLTEVDMRHFSQGYYVLKLESKKSSTVHKILVQ